MSKSLIRIFLFCFLTCIIHAEDPVQSEDPIRSEDTILVEDETFEEIEIPKSKKKFDFNEYAQNLIKLGDHQFLRKYFELPEPFLFLNGDTQLLRPSKMVNYTEKILPLFDNWNLNVFTGNNIFSVFTFADLHTDDGNEVKKINLKNFIDILLNEKPSKSDLKFTMPHFIRKSLEMPSVIQCKYLEDLYENANMEILVNYEKFSESRLSQSDQIICLAKGNLTLMMLQKKYAEQLMNITSKLDKSTYKVTQFLLPKIHSGECLYIPRNWYYAFQTDFSWFYSISWKPVGENVNVVEEWCANSTSDGKLSSYTFSKDPITPDNFNNKFGLILYFYLYSIQNVSSSLNFDEFLYKFKNDKNITLHLVDMDESSQVFIKNIFDSLDANKDNLLSVNDLDNMNEVYSNTAVDAIKENLIGLQNKLLEQMRSKQKALDDIMSKFESLTLDGDLKEDLIREKIAEMVYNLPENVREKLENENVEIDEVLLKEFKRIREEKHGKKQNKNKKKDKLNVKEEKKTDDSSDKDLNTETSFLNVNDEPVEDISADSSNTINEQKQKTQVKNEL